MRFIRALFAPGSPLSLQRTPQIGKDLPIKYLEAELIFDARVKERFPLGTREAEVVRVLEEQGFVRTTTSRGVASATFTRNDVVMKTIWSVRWRVAHGLITEIWGVHAAIAP
jgi:hypothetical protein